MKRTPIKRTNPKRRRKAFERNFGERGEAVRAMPCLVERELRNRFWNVIETIAELAKLAWSKCTGRVQACHVLARGMGGAKGDRRQLVPLCARHHAEAGEGSRRDEQPSKRAAFEARYGLDLKAEAERIAGELDERGIA